MATPTRTRLLTAEEFMALPADPESRRMELFDGEVICIPPPRQQAREASKKLLLALNAFVQEHDLGDVRFEIGFKIRSNPDRVVAPGVCWLSNEPLRRTGDPDGYLPRHRPWRLR